MPYNISSINDADYAGQREIKNTDSTVANVVRNKTPVNQEEPDVIINEDELKAKIAEVMNEVVDKQPISGDIINRIMRLLRDLIPSIQKLAMAEADKLALATNMQKMYTDMIAKIPVYVKEYKEGLTNAIVEADDTKREALNKESTALADTLRAYRDMWTDIAKKDQSSINNTNESINQQVDTLTEFTRSLKELGSLLFR